MSRKSPDPETQAKVSSSLMHKRRRWPLLFLGGILLLSGIVIGAAGGFFIDKMRRDNFFQHPERMPQLIAERLKSELSLSPEQVQQVEKILTNRLKVLREIQEESRPRLDKELDLLRDDVAQTLDENQSKEWLENFSKMRHFLPPPPHHPFGRPDKKQNL
jgi:hypothetical protein